MRELERVLDYLYSQAWTGACGDSLTLHLWYEGGWDTALDVLYTQF